MVNFRTMQLSIVEINKKLDLLLKEKEDKPKEKKKK